MPTEDEVAKIIKLISLSAVNYEYFFKKVDDPSWLKPLAKQHLFDSPPSASRDSNGNVIGASMWPPARLLARLASKSSSEVFNIANAINTDNYVVMSDLTEAAIAMPLDLAARWAEKMTLWLQKGHDSRGCLDELIGKLIAKVSTNDTYGIALKLASELLAVLPDPEAKAKQQKRNPTSNQPFEISTILTSLKPGTRCDNFNYEEILKKYIPTLSTVAPIETLKLLCQLLSNAILYSNSEGEQLKPYDYSFIWRPAIEDHAQNHRDSVENFLTTSVRDSAAGICNKNHDITTEIIQLVESYGWFIFKRIGCHLLRVSAVAPRQLIADRLLDDALYDESSLHHEYFHLIKSKFDILTKEEQDQILNRIKEAIPAKRYLNERNNDRDDKQTTIERWQYGKLIPIQKFLSGLWLAKYAHLAQKFKHLEMPPDFLTYTSEPKWVAPISPKKTEDLANMPVDALVEYLKTWKPTGNWESPTPDGLGCSIGALVLNEPERLATDIDYFMDPVINPTYIRHILANFKRSLESKKTAPFPAVLKLAKWVVDQPNIVPNPEIPESLREGIEVDRTWRNARSEIAGFLDKALEDEFQLPICLRNQVWSIIIILTKDPEPNVAYEEEYCDSQDPMTLSINTIRGQAMHAVMGYALWVCRNIKDDLNERENRKPSFQDIPEVKSILERHLDPTIDPARATRAVYGHWLPQLVNIDSEWVQLNLDRILPHEAELLPLRHAAWHTFLQYSSNLYKSVTRLLLGVYKDEVKRLSNEETDDEDDDKTEKRLSEHVLILYLWGEFGLEDGGLVDLLVSNASSKTLAHALDLIGHDTQKAETVNPDIVKRMKELWDWLIQKSGGYSNMDKEVLAAFAWWYAGGRFDRGWSIAQLVEVLKRTGVNRYPSEYLLKRLSSDYSKYPKESLLCLRSFIESITDPWFFYGERKKEGIWTLLEQGMAAKDADIRDQAEEIVHLLGAKGQLEFRDLFEKRLL